MPDFKRGALTREEIDALDDRGAGYYEDSSLPDRFHHPVEVPVTKPTETEKNKPKINKEGE